MGFFRRSFHTQNDVECSGKREHGRVEKGKSNLCAATKNVSALVKSSVSWPHNEVDTKKVKQAQKEQNQQTQPQPPARGAAGHWRVTL